MIKIDTEFFGVYEKNLVEIKEAARTLEVAMKPLSVSVERMAAMCNIKSKELRGLIRKSLKKVTF